MFVTSVQVALNLTIKARLLFLLSKRNVQLFLYLKEKVTKRSKQTCGLIACAALTELRTLLFMIFDMNIENLKAREGGLRWNS